MIEEKEIMKIITDDVNEQATLVIDQIQNEVTMSKEDQITYFKMGLNKEIETYLEKELNELRVLSVTKESQAKLQAKRDLLNLRTSLVDELFLEVLKELKEFVESKEYVTYLKKHLSKFEGKNGYLKIRKEDEEIFKEVIKSLKLDYKYEFYPYQLGGFTFIDIDNNIEYDQTLDTSLNDQKVWFQRESKFTI